MKIFHLLTVAGVVLLLAACSTTSPTESFRPAGSSATAWQIDGEFTPLHEVVIRFDGHEVMKGYLSLLTDRAELKGNYQNKPVSANCSLTRGLFSNTTECVVSVESEVATTLRF